MSVLLPLLPGTLPPNACYNNEQDRLVAFMNASHAVLDGQAFYNFGPDKPSNDNNAYPWFRTTDSRWYYYSGGWISRNPERDPNIRRLYVGDTTDLLTYDGGDNGTPSDRSGPMWEVDHDFDGRSPMGVGAISGSDPAKSLALDEDYGAGSVALAETHNGPHDHTITGYGTTGVETHIQAANNLTSTGIVTQTSSTSGDGTAHQNTHPVRGCYIIKPTSRLYYAVP